LLIKKDNAVHVRKATLLKLYGEEVSHGLSKYASLNVLYEILMLCIKCMDDHIWAICCCLTWLKGILNLWPGRICGHGKKEIASLAVTVDGQCILKKLLHVTCAFCKRRRKDDPLTEGLCVYIKVCSHCICQS
jgi:hypothetical protein